MDVARQMFLSFTLGFVLQTLLMIARYIAITAMFARNIDMIIDVPPAKRINFLSLPPDTRITTLPIFWATPDSNIALPITSIPKTRITVLLEKPEKASEKEHTPVIAKRRHAITLVTVEGIHSVIKNTMQKTKINKAIIWEESKIPHPFYF